jgi:hypothetical protein
MSGALLVTMDYRIEQLRYLLREDPSSRIFYQLGELLRREGQVEEAVTVLRSGIDRHPRYVAAWVSLGRTLVDRGDLVDAESAFRSALDIDPENGVAARLLGETAATREDWLAAVKALKLARALSGADESLDARIAEVELQLDERGELEERTTTPPPPSGAARSLEVVSLSSDDPFAADAPDVDAWDSRSDVFEIIQPPPADEPEPDGVVDPGSGAAPADEGQPDLSTAAIDVAALDLGAPEHQEDDHGALDQAAPEPGTAVAEAVPDDDRAAPAEEPATVVDESVVGAWSSSSHGGGVPTGEAWVTPTDHLEGADTRLRPESAWAEPETAAVATAVVAGPAADTEGPADTAPEPEPVADVPGAGAAEVVSDQHPGEPATVAADEASAAIGGPILADALPGEDRGFDDVEPTRPRSAESDTAPVEPPVEPADTQGDASADGDDGERDHGVPLPTMTLARLALDQGDRPLAVATLESLIERDPSHAAAQTLLDELRAEDEEEERRRLNVRTAAAKVSALRGWLDAVRLASERRLQ